MPLVVPESQNEDAAAAVASVGFADTAVVPEPSDASTPETEPYSLVVNQGVDGECSSALRFETNGTQERPAQDAAGAGLQTPDKPVRKAKLTYKPSPMASAGGSLNSEEDDNEEGGGSSCDEDSDFGSSPSASEIPLLVLPHSSPMRISMLQWHCAR